MNGGNVSVPAKVGLLFVLGVLGWVAVATLLGGASLLMQLL